MSSLSRKPYVVRPPSAVGTGCIRTFFGLFFLIGVWVFYLTTIQPLLQSAAALRWEETPCVVDSSRVEAMVSGGRGKPTYRVEVVYHYTFHGANYTAQRYDFATGPSAGRARKQRIVDQYPRGRQTVCYVNPGAPAEAVLYRGLNSEMAFGAIALIFAAVGGVGLFFSWRPPGPQSASQRNVVPTFAPATGEAVVLKPQLTPMSKFLGILAFGVVWNGFIGLFFYLIFLSPNHHAVPLVAKIFVGLFAFIGVLIIGGVIGSFLALFYPRVEITTRNSAVPLGGEFQFQWSIRGRAERLRKLRIVLEGREQASLQGGKRSHISTQVFAEIPVFESIDRDIVSQGQARVVVPAGLMHTFTGRHNRIVWRLRVRGEIPRLAPLEQEYNINVLPHGKIA